MHEQCATHNRAVEVVLTLPATTKDIGELLSSAHASEKATNRWCLLKILSNLRFLHTKVVQLGDTLNKPSCK